MTTQPTSDLSYEDILNKDILELMGAKDMPEDKQNQLYTKMLQTIQNRVILRIADELEEEVVAEWQQLVASNNKFQIDEFLHNHQIDMDKLMIEETITYKAEMIELSSPLTSALNS